ncbi:unnamed protein product [Boreogadus saida]
MSPGYWVSGTGSRQISNRTLRGEDVMMLPVSRLKGHQPVAMVTAPWPPLALPSEAPPPCLWFAGHSGGWYDLRPRPLYYPAPYWTPPEVSVVRVCWRSSGPKLVDGWIYPEDLAVFPRPTNQIPPRRHTPRTRPLLSPAAALLGLLKRLDWTTTISRLDNDDFKNEPQD